MSAVDFLFSPGIQKVLGQVYADPARSFTLNELLANAAGGRGNNQRQIERLLKYGALEEGPRRGRQRCIKANASYFLYNELRSIALKSFALKEPLLAALKPFQDQIEEAFVFGSIAKGTDTNRSDVDLIVVGEAPIMKITAMISGVEQTIGRAIHLSLYSPQEWRQLKTSDPVLAQIANGPKLRILPDDFVPFALSSGIKS